MINSYFSPKGYCEQTIVRYINKAKTSICGCIYSFTNKRIAQALLTKSSITSLIIDPSIINEPGTVINLLKPTLSIRQDNAHKIMHNKYLIIDGKIVITGSYNWSEAAETMNAENLIVIPSKNVASAFLINWNLHWSHSIGI